MAGWTVVPNGDTSAWKPVAPPPAQNTEPEGMMEPLQRAFDSATARKDHSADQGVMGNIGTGMRNMATGVLGMAAPLVHPIKTLESMSVPMSEANDLMSGKPGALHNAMQNDPLVNTGKSFAEHPLESAEQMGGAALAGKVGGMAMSKLAPVMRSGAGTINDALIGTPSKSMRYGAQPGLQMAKEGITGSSPARLASVLEDRIPDAAAEHRAIVSQAPANTMINSGPLVRQPFQDAIAGATNPTTGAGGVAPIKAALRTERELSNVIDPDTGKVTMNMRNPHISPLEATQLKSNLYGRINYDDPSKMALSNSGLKGAAHNLKDAVETAVPESIPAGQRLHNLMSAKDIIEPAARSQRIPTSKAGFLDRVVMGTGTRGASGLYGAGNIAAGIGDAPIAPVTALVSRLRDEKKKEQ